MTDAEKNYVDPDDVNDDAEEVDPEEVDIDEDEDVDIEIETDVDPGDSQK